MLSRCGTISAVSNRTDEAITHAVLLVHLRGEPLGQRLGRPDSDLDDRHPLLRQPIELPTHRVKLAVGRHDARAASQRQRRQPARDQFVRVLPEREVPRIVAKQGAESLADETRLLLRGRPFVVHELGCVEPCTLLRQECDVWPCLVGVAGQQGAIGYAEAGVVGRQRHGARKRRVVWHWSLLQLSPSAHRGHDPAPLGDRLRLAPERPGCNLAESPGRLLARSAIASA